MVVKKSWFFHIMCLWELSWACQQLYDHSLNSMTITCTNISSLSQLPSVKIQAASIEITILHSNILILPPSKFVYYPNVSKLFLNHLQLTHISPGAFSGLEELTELHLDNNRLMEIRVGLYNHLHKLKILDFSNNQIKVIQRSSLAGLGNLEELYLGNNDLTTVENYMFQHQTRLRLLDVSGNPLMDFCTNNLPNLVFLNLSHTRISTVDVNFCGIPLSNVKNLTVAFSQLEVLDKFTLVKSANVEDLDLRFNRISEMSRNTLRAFKNLYRLSLSYNNLTVLVPGLLTDLVKLNVLDLSHNQIERLLCGTFDTLTELRVLDISYNQLVSLESYYFQSLFNLRKWYFASNQVSFLDIEDILKRQRRLDTVSLNHNPWKCEILVPIYDAFNNKKVLIEGAGSFEVENYHGISCSSEMEPVKDHLLSGSKMQRFFNEDFVNSTFFRYFQEDFSESSFFRVLESFFAKSDSKVEKLIGEDVVGENKNDSYMLLTFICMMQFVISFLLLLLLMKINKRY